jgi:hypothetical protein
MKRILLVLLAALCLALPSDAAQTTVSKLKNHLTVTGNLVVSGTTTHTGAVTNSSTTTNTGTVTNTGNVTVGGTLGVTGAVSLTVPLTAANIQSGSAKRMTQVIRLSPETGACADSTVYRGYATLGRVGTVTRVTLIAGTAPTVGTDTIKVRKNTVAGNNILTADFDANTLVAATATSPALTATGADLALLATEGVYCEYSAGTQTVDAINVNAVVEFEPTDF